MYGVDSFMLMTKFTLNIVSGIELPAMYKVNTFNLTESTCNYQCICNYYFGSCPSLQLIQIISEKAQFFSAVQCKS